MRIDLCYATDAVADRVAGAVRVDLRAAAQGARAVRPRASVVVDLDLLAAPVSGRCPGWPR